MNGIILQLIKWLIEKEIMSAGREANWPDVKATVDKKLDEMLPDGIYDKVARFLAAALLDIVAAYFTSSGAQVTSESIHKSVEHANLSLAGAVAAKLLG